MDTGPALSSTPRKSIGKPMLRLSIPTPNAQFTSPKVKSEPSSSALNVNKSMNVDNIVDNCPHIDPNATNKNNASEVVEKLIRSERLAQPNKCRSDGSSASPVQVNGFAKHSPHHEPDAVDGDDNEHSNACLPSYKSFESDFRRRIDEINAANRFDMRLKGNDLLIFCFAPIEPCQWQLWVVNWQLMFEFSFFAFWQNDRRCFRISKHCHRRRRTHRRAQVQSRNSVE